MEKRIVIVIQEEKKRIQLACAFLRHGRTEIELYTEAENIREPDTVAWLVTDIQMQDRVSCFPGEHFVLGTKEMQETVQGIFLDEQLDADVLYETMNEWMEKKEADGICQEEEERTRLLVTASLTGGCGKTEGSILLCRKLAVKGKKVLYCNLEDVQDFYFYLDEEHEKKRQDLFLTEDLSEKTDCDLAEEQFTYTVPADPFQEESTTQMLAQSQFFYVKPWKKVPAQKEEIVQKRISMILQLQEEHAYDVIVAELPAKNYRDTEFLTKEAEKILLFTRQDYISGQKLLELEQELQGQQEEQEKYLYICGLYEESKKNELEDLEITEYVPYFHSHRNVGDLEKQGCLDLTAEILK